LVVSGRTETLFYHYKAAHNKQKSQKKTKSTIKSAQLNKNK